MFKNFLLKNNKIMLHEGKVILWYKSNYEAWIIKSSPSLIQLESEIDFSSNDLYFDTFVITNNEIKYRSNDVDTVVYSNGEWINDNFKTVKFYDSPSGTLLEWLEQNAEIVGLVSIETSSGDILTDGYDNYLVIEGV